MLSKNKDRETRNHDLGKIIGNRQLSLKNIDEHLFLWNYIIKMHNVPYCVEHSMYWMTQANQNSCYSWNSKYFVLFEARSFKIHLPVTTYPVNSSPAQTSNTHDCCRERQSRLQLSVTFTVVTLCKLFSAITQLKKKTLTERTDSYKIFR